MFLFQFYFCVYIKNKTCSFEGAAGGLEIAEFRGSKAGNPSLVKGAAGVVKF